MTTSPTLARKAKLKTHLVSAKAKLKLHVTPRRVVLLAAAACSVFLILSTLRTLHSASRRTATPAAASTPAAVAAVHHAQHEQEQRRQEECGGKAVPASVAEALVHYATSGETPRQTEAEAGAAARVLAARTPCNLLVFGLGPASALWVALNHGGRTLFLEADAGRIAAARAAHPAGVDDLQAHTVAYHDQHAAQTTVSDDLLLLRNSSDCAGARRCVHGRRGGAGTAARGGRDGRAGPRRGRRGGGELREGVPVRRVHQGGGWQAPSLRHPEPQGQGSHTILPLRDGQIC
ncbi:hypothetical protein SEVIR_8G082500v4 [Setaria viridis]